MSLPTSVEQTLHRFKEKLRERCGSRILEIRVFGSVARGEQHAESDVDVFVMVDHRDAELDRAIVHAALESNDETGLYWLLTPFIRSRSDFEALLSAERRIALDIMREGVPV